MKGSNNENTERAFCQSYGSSMSAKNLCFIENSFTSCELKLQIHCAEAFHKTRSKPQLQIQGLHPGGCRAEAYSALKQLEAVRWLDRHTRAVLVEMTLFNPATTLFSCVTLLLEIPPSGGTTPSAQVTSVYLYKYISPWDNFILACEVRTYVIVQVPPA